MRIPVNLSLFLGVVLAGCAEKPATDHAAPGATDFADPPEWAQTAIWYQIFVERFRNGDPTNDPRPEDMVGAYPGFVPDSWTITPWTHDWYAPDPYFAEARGQTAIDGQAVTHFGQLVRLRRYGGDLQGVLDKLDYLQELGVTAIYFNPLNDAPSQHKFDARHWRHIDRNFGPTPRQDVATMAAEVPDDPTTWQWTGADRLFLEVVAACHERGMRVIMDYSFNHTGVTFWAWQDILDKQADSRYADWYWINRFDDPETPEDELDYPGWFGSKSLVQIKETQYVDHQAHTRPFSGDFASEAVKNQVFAVARRWLDPDQDGDPSDGVDGYRLDVAAEVPLGFWRDFRREVRAVNPEAYLVGEIWFEIYPDSLLDPAPLLRGDIFDAIMNYRWYKPTRQFFAKAPVPMSVTDYVARLERLQKGIRPANQQAMMNLASSHDAPRLATSLFNRQTKYKYGVGPGPDNNYKIHKPTPEVWPIQQMLLVQQFTYVGAPHIWAGDEMGMWGADMGDTRKPLIWPDYTFDPETTHPYDKSRPLDSVAFRPNIFQFYQKLAQFRQQQPVLATGSLEFLHSEDSTQTLAYRRYDDRSEILVAFNLSERSQSLTLAARHKDSYRELLTGQTVPARGEQITWVLAPQTAAVFY